MTKSPLPFLFLAFTSLALADDQLASTPTRIDPVPGASEPAGLQIEAATGFDSLYLFRGEYLFKNTPWAELSLTAPLTESLALKIRPWYLWAADDDFEEFDLQGELSLSAGEYEIGLGYAGYFYPNGALGAGEGISDEQEMTLSVSRDVGPVALTVLGARSFSRDGFYYEVSAELPYEVSHNVTLYGGVVVGADTDYFGRGTQFNHVKALLSMDYLLTENLTLSTYLAQNIPLGSLKSAGDDLFGGVALYYAF